MKRTWLFYGTLLVVSIIAIRQIPALTRSMSNVASYVLYPILVIEHALLEPVKTWYKKRLVAEDLTKALHESEVTCIALQQENIELKAVVSTFQQMRDITAFRNRYKTSNAILAPILLRQFSDTAHYILVDGGSNRGIEPDMVAVYKNCLIGRVTDVYRWYSKVVLTTDRGCKVAAVCVQTGAQGIHEGAHDTARTQLSFVSHLTKLKKGDLVISSGEGLVFPRGFALGRVKSYALDGLHYAITIEPLVDVRSLDACYILAKGSAYDAAQKVDTIPSAPLPTSVTKTQASMPVVQEVPQKKTEDAVCAADERDFSILLRLD